jgi:hypothetical protein
MTVFDTRLRGTCPQMGALIHTFGGLIHTWVGKREYAVFRPKIRHEANSRLAAASAGVEFRVEHLPESTNIPAEVVVLGHLALDLLAAMQHG